MRLPRYMMLIALGYEGRGSDMTALSLAYVVGGDEWTSQRIYIAGESLCFPFFDRLAHA